MFRAFAYPLLRLAIALVLVAPAGAVHARDTAPATAMPLGAELHIGPRDGAMRISSEAAQRRCARWQTIAAALGETLAGHRLRKSVVADACALAETGPRLEPAWGWPWRDSGLRGELPPRLVGEHGEWSVRCGLAGRRQRCALLHEVAIASDAGPGSADDEVRIITHFVIDQVARRESVIWRLFVERAGDARHSRIEVDLEGSRRGETFDLCARKACLMEAGTAVSAEAANRLWDGRAVTITIRDEALPSLLFHVPAMGFKSGLAKLIRLRQEEWRGVATQASDRELSAPGDGEGPRTRGLPH